jgi:hypothetical protein
MQISRLVHTALIAGAIFTVPPAYAQEPGMFTGDDDAFFDTSPYRDPAFCIEITDHRLRQMVAEQGFSNIYLNVRNDERIQVRATRGDWVYLLQVSTCTGSIVYGQRLRPA